MCISEGPASLAIWASLLGDSLSTVDSPSDKLLDDTRLVRRNQYAHVTYEEASNIQAGKTPQISEVSRAYRTQREPSTMTRFYRNTERKNLGLTLAVR